MYITMPHYVFTNSDQNRYQRYILPTKIIYSPVCAYDTGTFQIDICDVTEAKNFPNANGMINLIQYLHEMSEYFRTPHKLKNGPLYSVIDVSWTMVTVIGYGKVLNTIFPMTLFELDTTYQIKHNAATLNICLLFSTVIVSLYTLAFYLFLNFQLST